MLERLADCIVDLARRRLEDRPNAPPGRAADGTPSSYGISCTLQRASSDFIWSLPSRYIPILPIKTALDWPYCPLRPLLSELLEPLLAFAPDFGSASELFIQKLWCLLERLWPPNHYPPCIGFSHPRIRSTRQLLESIINLAPGERKQFSDLAGAGGTFKWQQAPIDHKTDRPKSLSLPRICVPEQDIGQLAHAARDIRLSGEHLGTQAPPSGPHP